VPEIGIGTIDVFSEDDRKFTIVFDASSGLPYMIASREGPTGSDIVKVYKDKVGVGYDKGYEIPWSMKPKEHRGKREEDLIRHLESHFHMRPQSEANKGKAGYDSNGFRNAQEITVKAYQNGEVVEDAVTTNIPNKGDITFDKKIEANRVQLELSGTASEIKIVRHNTDYNDKDIRGAPSLRVMQEQQYQNELGAPYFWLCRGDNLLLDRATGNEPTGTVFGFRDGPDEEMSAIIFAATSTLVYPHSYSYQDFTVMFGLSGIISTVEVFRLGTAIISITYAGGVYILNFNDGVNTYSQELNWDGTGWVLLKLARHGEHILFSENGELLNREMLVSVVTLTGNIDFQAGNEKRIFDVRIYPDNIDEDTFAYYYRDVMTNQGFALLC